MLMTERWIATKVQQILETDDDMVVDFIYNLLDGERYVRCPDKPCFPSLPR